MPLTPAEIDIAYRLLLERRPSPAESANIGGQYGTLPALRQAVLGSDEFQRKYAKLKADFDARQTPILVHPVMPETACSGLLAILDSAPALQPAHRIDTFDLPALRAMPRPERRALRLVEGDLPVDAGEALGLPYRRLCLLRRPEDRLYRIYRAACRAHDSDMAFGAYLELSLDAPEHRVELDNGQMRRLAGAQETDGFGREPALLRAALHAALDPAVILGLAEEPGAVVQDLVDEGFVDLPEEPPQDDPPEDGAAEALAALGTDQRRIFDAYTAWDSYLYQVCAAQLFPPTD